jgi:F-type H+-transporting ATPase subunit gamma
MSDTTAGLRQKIGSAGDLQAVVRTMKSLAASSINQYEQSVHALADYARTVELGLSICFRGIGNTDAWAGEAKRTDAGVIGAVVFGSDQGLVGQFNDLVAERAVQTLGRLTSPLTDESRRRPQVWAVGERVHARLADAGLALAGTFSVPTSVAAITALVAKILVATEAHQRQGEYSALYLFYNRPSSAAVYAPVEHRLLPLDARWQRSLAAADWPTNNLPEVIGGDSGAGTATLRALIREHLFVSLFRACAESLASENASRLAAMQRADKNIEDLLETLNGTFHQLRQSGIDAELFDVIAGFEALAEPRRSGQQRSSIHQDGSKATMLITFQTKAYANITMFGDVAIALLKLMGHSGTVPGALMADDVPAALAHLQAAVQARPDEPLDPTDATASDGEDGAAREPRASGIAPDRAAHRGCRGARKRHVGRLIVMGR